MNNRLNGFLLVSSFLVFLGLISILCGCGTTAAGGGGASGTPGLDSTFGAGGIVTHDNAAGGHGDDVGRGVVINSSGEILVVGTSSNESGNFDMTIWKYSSTGSLDATFGISGIVTHDSAAGGHLDDAGYAIALDHSGKIVVAGYSENASVNRDLAIWRYTANGTLDTTFNSVGYVTHNNAAGGNGDDHAYSLVIDASDNIYATGRSDNGADLDMVTWKYDSSGALVAGFGTGGVVTYNSGSGIDDFGRGITIDALGKIIVAGHSGGAGGNDVVIWKYDSSGALVAGFGTGGVATFELGSDCYIYGLALVPGNKILVTGYVQYTVPSASIEMLAVQFNSSGTLDAGPLVSNFAYNGYLTHDIAPGAAGEDCGQAVVLLPSGKFMIAGYTLTTPTVDGNDMALWCYNVDEILDTSFNSVGYLTHNNAAGGNKSDFAWGAAVDPSGKVVIVGDSMNASGNYDMAIWRTVSVN